MTLLPGQRTINGVSNFLFGTNLGQQGTRPSGVFSTPAIQQLIKNAGLQIMRIGNMAGQSNAFIDASLAAVQACGCQVLIVLDLNNLAANEAVISYVGTRCMIYEFGNEPDSVAHGSLTGSQYYSLWSAQVPTLRTFAPNGTFFVGPVVTAGALSGSFISDWLTACAGVGGTTLPDAISWHEYPCTTTNKQATCNSRSTIFSSDVTTVDTVVRGILGHSLPYCVSEWSVSGGSNQQSYCLDPSFVTPWVYSAIDNMVSAGLALACQFEAGTGEGNGQLDLIHATIPGFPPGPIFQPLADKIVQYLSGDLLGYMTHT